MTKARLLPPGGLTISVALTAGFLAGCSETQERALPTPPTASAITAASPTTQSSLVKSEVLAPPSVEVRDQNDEPLPGIKVTFTVTQGNGSITGANSTTDANGIATAASWTLGPVAGPNVVNASVAATGVTGNPVTFTATGTNTAPASITANSPTSETAVVGTPVPLPPSVVVLDDRQVPVAGVTVTFAVTGGGGTVTGDIQSTDAKGQATAGGWTLGPVEGANTLTAAIAGSGITGNPVTFSATGAAAADTAAVRWATFWGGTSEDQVRDVATDAHGNTYVVGGTTSNDFPTTPGAFDQAHDDSPNGTVRHYDVFVTKFDSTGKLVWSTLLGGPGYDRAYAVEVDAQGFVYVGGRAGVGFPVTPGAAQTTFRGGSVTLYGEQDGFVCKLRPDGSALVFCTYFGTSDANIVRDLDIDARGAVYIASSAIVRFPASDSYFDQTFQPIKRSGQDGVIAKLNASGTAFVWATYLGGGRDDGTQPSVRVDGQGNVWYVGGTTSTDLPLQNAAQSPAGGVDLYLAKLSADGKHLLVGTYLGGTGFEGSETHNLAVNRTTGDVYVGSSSSSTDLPVTPNALQPAPGGNGDAIVARYDNAGHLLNLSYLGGMEGDRIEGIVVGDDGLVYASGAGLVPYLTRGVAGPPGGSNAAGVILNADLTGVVFAVGLSGSLDDSGRGVAPFPDGGFVMGGLTPSPDLPVPDAAQPTYGGSTSDGWIARIIPR